MPLNKRAGAENTGASTVGDVRIKDLAITQLGRAGKLKKRTGLSPRRNYPRPDVLLSWVGLVAESRHDRKSPQVPEETVLSVHASIPPESARDKWSKPTSKATLQAELLLAVGNPGIRAIEAIRAVCVYQCLALRDDAGACTC